MNSSSKTTKSREQTSDSLTKEAKPSNVLISSKQTSTLRSRASSICMQTAAVVLKLYSTSILSSQILSHSSVSTSAGAENQAVYILPWAGTNKMTWNV